MADEFVPDEEFAATLGAAYQEQVDRNDRIMAFCDAVQEMPGQLGNLLRQIAHAHNEFTAAEQWGGTTVGENIRLAGVIDEAMDAWDWLTEGVQP